MKYLLPWKKDTNFLDTPAHPVRKDLLTGYIVAELSYRGLDRWSYCIMYDNTFYTLIPNFSLSKEEAMEACDKRLLEIGFKLIPEDQVQKYKEKLITLL